MLYDRFVTQSWLIKESPGKFLKRNFFFLRRQWGSFLIV